MSEHKAEIARCEYDNTEGCPYGGEQASECGCNPPPRAEIDALFDPDALTVCIEHGAFVPCRRSGHHYESQNPYWVKAVRDFQESSVEGLTWEPASEYAARRMSSPPDKARP